MIGTTYYWLDDTGTLMRTRIHYGSNRGLLDEPAGIAVMSALSGASLYAASVWRRQPVAAGDRDASIYRGRCNVVYTTLIVHMPLSDYDASTLPDNLDPATEAAIRAAIDPIADAINATYVGIV